MAGVFIETMNIDITPLDRWIVTRTASRFPGEPTTGITTQLEAYQLWMLKKTLTLAREKSPFYRNHLKGINLEDLRSVQDIRQLPFVFARDLADHGLQMLCVSQGEIARVTTLQTSGTTARPKRIFFTQHDMENTAEFFTRGMATLVKPGQRVMVLMPGPNFGSVGERVKTGLSQMGCSTLVNGFVDNPGSVVKKIAAFRADCIIGLPVQVLSLARSSRATAHGSSISTNRIKSVLLTGDYVPLSIIRAIKEIWHCPVFIHYGMTETGLGGGVECRAQRGCHLREADLFFEIIDENGYPLPLGQVGEVTVTTLTRTGMPLIRYRTGDRACFLEDLCPCGSRLKRLDRVRGRSVVRLGSQEIRLDEMDEAVFKLDNMVDFQVTLVEATVATAGIHLLNVEFWSIPDKVQGLERKIEQALYKIPAIRHLMDQGELTINSIFASNAKLFSRPIKRSIKQERIKKKINV
ncbi:coenzyme F390 synthetase-like protein [Desulforapulum autotrophicum HRM2]|uniref:Coenzyme F390 synthetase-like protein n=2 Tax=Desulforapulum autotrophicum TaxID=2296 RepID=C0QJ26_DESAH|nr:coenzyme F390 synthetase-like protein [Desulforapulum autotrophicum HRM2]